MIEDEIIAGLKAGGVLCLDGAATEQERNMIWELDKEGLVDITEHATDQYTVLRIKWKPNSEA